MKKSVRIGLLGMYGSTNLGDTAIQAAVMNALHSRRPNIDFVGLCPDPEDTARTHGIPSFAASGRGRLVIPHRDSATDNRTQEKNILRPSKKFALFYHLHVLRNIERQMRNLDMLIVSGGGQIDDHWGGPWQQPFRLFVWCMCARLYRKPIAAFALGVDNLRFRLSAWFATHALKMAQYRAFRDSGSLDLLRNKGMDSASNVCPDPAFAFCPAAGRTETVKQKNSKFAVISPISKNAFPGTGDAEYDAYLTALARVAEDLQQKGIEVRFVCSQTKMDPPAALRIAAQMKSDTMISFPGVKTVDDFVLFVSGAEFIIASRLHALILSLVTGTPTIAVSPARKVRQQMIDVGLEDYCFDLNSLQISHLLSTVQGALDRRNELNKNIVSRVNELRCRLEEAFEKLSTFIPSLDH